MHSLSLHHLIAREVSATELVTIAASLECSHVDLFVQDPGTSLSFPVIEDAEVMQVRRTLDGCGVEAYGLSAFTMTGDVDVRVFEPALARGAQLGGTIAIVCIVDQDEARVIENFGRFSELTTAYGMEASIEFMGFGATNALGQAVRVARSASPARATVTLDTLHIVRTGTLVTALEAVDQDLRGCVQLSDGSLDATAAEYQREAAYDRLLPGEGSFPLHDILALVPGDRPIALEIPMERLRERGMTAYERARLIVEATRHFLAESRSI